MTYTQYDEAGNVVTVSNQVNASEWQVTHTKYDEQNRPVLVINPDMTTSRKISTLYPDGNHEDAEYDLIGNRIARIDCNGVRTEYQYDCRNQPH